ncbi:DUF4440 domain-containing protein [Pedobacter sp. HMF7647]|uniref:DUF4440 domain-containing protein n=1 Tax=Hufsiella arboris TaxID=2695275 RepID=A0A7K1Y8R6_9SPHI|nr:nuclear transport factor 2 family protein [Hufsiella arboris]MXV50967.1 DUF4440 domain-containing protein [Hufsiella arboris]
MEINKTDIEAIEARLVEGIKAGDVGFLDKLLHDDLLCITPNGKTITKAMDLASHKSREMIVDKLTHNIENISIIGDTAVATVIYDAAGVMLGEPISGKFKYIRVWKLVDDGLKVIAASCCQID